MGQVIAFPTPTRRVLHPAPQAGARPQAASVREASDRATRNVADVLIALEAATPNPPLVHLLKPLFGPPFVAVRVGGRIFQLTADEARTACVALLEENAYVGCVSDAFALKDAARAADALTLHRDRGGA